MKQCLFNYLNIKLKKAKHKHHNSLFFLTKNVAENRPFFLSRTPTYLCVIIPKRLFRSSCLKMFCRKSVLRNFVKFTRKHLFQSLFFNKVAGLQVFSYEFCEISKNTSGDCFWVIIWIETLGLMFHKLVWDFAASIPGSFYSN